MPHPCTCPSLSHGHCFSSFSRLTPSALHSITLGHRCLTRLLGPLSHPCNSDLRLQPPNLLRPLSPVADPTPALATTSCLLLRTLLPLATTPTQLREWCLTLVITRLVVAPCTPILTSDPTSPDLAQPSAPAGLPSMLAPQLCLPPVLTATDFVCG